MVAKTKAGTSKARAEVPTRHALSGQLREVIEERGLTA